jgi:pimeloyl-ACP methyl ester carboxylesterase
MSLAFYVHYPQRVQALILQGCGPGYRNPEARMAWNARAEERAYRLETQGLALLGGGAEVRHSVQRSTLGLARAARGILTQQDAQVIDSLPHITVPTLIMIGENDTPFVHGAHYMASRIPKVTHVVVKNARHGANVEQPDVVNDAMRQFLARL